MFKLNDIVTWVHPKTGQTRTGVIVRVYDHNGSERYVVQVWRQFAWRQFAWRQFAWRQFARRPRHYRPNPKWLKKYR